MVAKTALYILGGLLIIPGIFQFINIIQLQAYRDTFMGAAIDAAIDQKIILGVILLLIGALLVFCGFKIKITTAEG